MSAPTTGQQNRHTEPDVAVDARYFLLSGKPSAERFAHVVRFHWAIENADAPHRTPGRIAVKVINHLGDEVMKVFRL